MNPRFGLKEDLSSPDEPMHGFVSKAPQRKASKRQTKHTSDARIYGPIHPVEPTSALAGKNRGKIFRSKMTKAFTGLQDIDGTCGENRDSAQRNAALNHH